MRIVSARISILLIAVGAVIAAACSSSTTAPPVTLATPPPSHLYVSDFTGNLYVYTLPLNAVSQPSVTLAGQAAFAGIAVSQNKLYNGPYVFQLPLTSTSVRTAVLTTTSNVIDDAADANGTIYLAENMNSTCCIDVYQGGATSPTFTLSGASVNAPFGVAMDFGGNLFLANAGSIGYFATPVHAGEAGITFGRDSFNEGLVTDSSANLYVADGNGLGTIDYYHPPYAVASAPGTPATIGGKLYQMAIGPDGTMYIMSQLPSQIDVLTPPYTSIAFAVPTSWTGYGVAVGP